PCEARELRHGPAPRGGFEHRGEDVAPGDTVDGGVMDLGVDRRSPAAQPGDEVELPQGAAAIQRTGVDAGHLIGQLRVTARGGQGKLADVELDVEVRVVDPVRMVEA